MSEGTKRKERKPELRLKGFEGAWDLKGFDVLTYLAGEKNRDNLPLESYSISNEKGFVPQDEQFENGGVMHDADKRMYYIVQPQSFAYNPARINVGSIGYSDLDKPVIVSSLYEVFKTTSEVDDRFLWYWFKSTSFQKKIEEFQEGGVRLYFYYDKLCMCSLPLPNIGEQKVIGEYFSNLDTLITHQQHKYDQLQNLKKAMLEKMFPRNGADVPEIRFKGFEGAWVSRTVKELTIELSEYLSMSSGLPLLTSSRNGLIYQNEYRGNLTTKDMDALFSVVPVGACTYRHMSDDDIFHLNINTLEKGLVSPEYPVFIASKDTCLNFVVLFINSSSDFRTYCAERKKGGTRTRLYYNDLCKFSIMIPDKYEQDAIAEYFQNLDNLISQQQKKLDHLKHLKAALLDKMFVSEKAA